MAGLKNHSILWFLGSGIKHIQAENPTMGLRIWEALGKVFHFSKP